MGGRAIRVSGTLVEGGDVYSFDSFGGQFVYVADQEQDGVDELFATLTLAPGF